MHKALISAFSPDDTFNVVGRDREIFDIANSLREIFLGPKRGVVWVSGGSGTGKSSVIQQAIRSPVLEQFFPFRTDTVDFSLNGALWSLGQRLFNNSDDYYSVVGDAAVLDYFRQNLSLFNDFGEPM